MAWGWDSFGDYVSADEKRRLEKKGRKLSPVQPAGRSVAESFWGRAWCQNLERYSDYASRLPRGRSYLRQGAVLDLQIARGSVRALVSGTRLYEVGIQIGILDKTAWTRLKKECAGKVGSLMDLLRGRLAGPIMEIVTRKDAGLFPKSTEIHLKCSCPDYAGLCKHVAATLYGVGSRLDEQPELLFILRGVDHLELIASATDAAVHDLAAPAAGSEANTLDESSLTEIFGIEIDGAAGPQAAPKPAKRAAKTASERKPRARQSPASRPARKTTAAKPARASRKEGAPAKVTRKHKAPLKVTRSVRKARR